MLNVDGKCLQTCIVYKADVMTNKESHIYYGASDGELNLGTITTQIRHRHHEQDTELSKHIWKLQDKGINFTLNGVSYLMPQHTDVVQEGVTPV